MKSNDASASGGGLLLCVYRARNAARVRKLLRMAREAGLRAQLWALDETLPDLASDTLGEGPGGRVDLLNALFVAGRGAQAGVVVVADDDIEFVRGDLETFLDTVERAGFDLAQPAHARGSHVSHEITRRRALSVARRTDFVEIGPLNVVRRPWIGRVFPMPEDFGMGYGLDLLWQDLGRAGCRMGVVDAVTLRHEPPASATYDAEPELRRLAALLAERGISEMWRAQNVLATWRPWRRRAPWRTGGAPT